jgi:hypothetical protein
MMTIASVGIDHYRIPLPVVLSDSTHGDIAEFELVTVRVRDAAGTDFYSEVYFFIGNLLDFLQSAV